MQRTDVYDCACSTSADVIRNNLAGILNPAPTNLTSIGNVPCENGTLNCTSSNNTNTNVIPRETECSTFTLMRTYYDYYNKTKVAAALQEEGLNLTINNAEPCLGMTVPKDFFGFSWYAHLNTVIIIN